MAHRDLTDDEHAALEAFAKAHGRTWRRELTDVYWYNARIWAGPVPGMGTTLHGIRNDFGPTWLYDIYKPRKLVADRLFIGTFPGGIAYCDRHREEHGDYKRLGFLPFDTLALEIKPGCPAELRREIERHAATLQARKGQRYQISTVVLGWALRDKVEG